MPTAYTPKQGFEWNPLRRYPRNAQCPCGKEVKFKNCCYKIIGPVVKKEDYATLKKFVDGALELQAQKQR